MIQKEKRKDLKDAFQKNSTLMSKNYDLNLHFKLIVYFQMFNFNLYAQLSITAGVAKQFKRNSQKRSRECTVLKQHRSLKSQLASAIRKKMSKEEFLLVLKKGKLKTTAAKRAHQLLHYDPSEFTKMPYITREAFVHAVYSAHYNESRAGPKLALWFKEIK